MGNFFTVNGGNGGASSQGSTPGNTAGQAGSAPGTTLTYAQGILYEDAPYSLIGLRGNANSQFEPGMPTSGQQPGQAGGKGFLAFYINDLA